MGHAKRKRNRKRQERLAIKEARKDELKEKDCRQPFLDFEKYRAILEARNEEDYAYCRQLFLSLEKLQSEYGFLQEQHQILRDLLEMSITNDAWGVEREVFLGANREKTREMGYRLHEIGGCRLMIEILDHMYKDDQRELELSWDGIGGWKA